MGDVAIRELRNDTSGVLRRVERGERVRVTVSGRPAAVIVPLEPRPRLLGWNDLWATDDPAGVPAALADTSIFSTRAGDRPLRGPPPERIAVSVVTIGELRSGLLAATDAQTRARRLRSLTTAASLTPLPVDEDVVAAWAELRVALRDAGHDLPVNDSWIAATALAHNLPVATRDVDYGDVPGLATVRL